MAEPKTFPPSQDLKFLLCEDVRREQTGKLLLIGVYPAEQIVIHRAKPIKESAGVAAVETLVFLFIGKNGLGQFEGRLTIDSPDGQRIFDTSVGQVVLRENASTTAIAAFRPFPVRAFGQHRVTLFLDDTPYSFTFEIREGRQAGLKEKRAPKGRKRKPR